MTSDHRSTATSQTAAQSAIDVADKDVYSVGGDHGAVLNAVFELSLFLVAIPG